MTSLTLIQFESAGGPILHAASLKRTPVPHCRLFHSLPDVVMVFHVELIGGWVDSRIPALPRGVPAAGLRTPGKKASRSGEAPHPTSGRKASEILRRTYPGHRGPNIKRVGCMPRGKDEPARRWVSQNEERPGVHTVSNCSDGRLAAGTRGGFA